MTADCVRRIMYDKTQFSDGEKQAKIPTIVYPLWYSGFRIFNIFVPV